METGPWTHCCCPFGHTLAICNLNQIRCSQEQFIIKAVRRSVHPKRHRAQKRTQAPMEERMNGVSVGEEEERESAASRQRDLHLCTVWKHRQATGMNSKRGDGRIPQNLHAYFQLFHPSSSILFSLLLFRDIRYLRQWLPNNPPLFSCSEN